MDFPRTVYQGQNVRLQVLPLSAVESDMEFPEQHILISISEPQEILHWAAPKITPSETRLATLTVNFFDVEETIGNCSTITSTQAREIAKFVKNYKVFDPLIVIHCRAGMSRSPAVAAAIAKHYDDNDAYFFEHFIPNNTVYRRVLEALPVS